MIAAVIAGHSPTSSKRCRFFEAKGMEEMFRWFVIHVTGVSMYPYVRVRVAWNVRWVERWVAWHESSVKYQHEGKSMKHD